MGTLEEIGLRIAHAPSLVVHEEEGLVVPDGAAQRPAELVLAKGRLGAAELVVEQIIGVELVIAQKLEPAAVELIRAGLDLDIHDAAVGPAELRGVRAGLNLEFLDRVHAGKDDHGVQIQFVVVDAIEQEVVVAGAHAIGDEGGRHAPAFVAGAIVVRTGHASRDTWNQPCQLDEVPAVQRQFLDLRLVHSDAQLRAVGLHQRDGGLHLNRFRHVADFQLQIDARLLIDVEPDARRSIPS